MQEKPVTWIVESVLTNTKRGRHPLGDSPSPTPAATPPQQKRAKFDSFGSACITSKTEQAMEAPLGVTLSQSMDSVNTNNGEEEVS